MNYFAVKQGAQLLKLTGENDKLITELEHLRTEFARNKEILDDAVNSSRLQADMIDQLEAQLSKVTEELAQVHKSLTEKR